MKCAVHLSRRVQQNAISCTRTDYNFFFLKKKKTSCQSVTLSSLVRKPLQQFALFCDAAHVTSSEELDFDEFYELHQESFHCHHDVLDEEDECHF